MTRLEKAILLLAVLVFVTLLFFIFANADEVKKPSYAPTEVQTLRLQLKQRDAQLAQKDYFIAQQNFAAAVKALDDEGERVKSENKWPSTVNFDKDKLSFSESLKDKP